MRHFTAALIFLVLSAPGLAQKETVRPDSPEQMAEKVLAAHKAKDEAAISGLAAKVDPDPWLVADELLARGALDAADGFAAAGSWDDAKELRSFLRSQREKPTSDAARSTLRDAKRANGKRDYARVLALVPSDPAETDVCSLRTFRQRLVALIRLRRFREAVPTLRRAHEVAASLGWRSRALTLLNDQAIYLCRVGSLPKAIEVWREMEVVAGKWKRAGSAATARIAVAVAYRKLGRLNDSLALLERVKVDCEREGDRVRLASALNSLGNVYRLLGRIDESLDSFRSALEIYDALSDPAAAARTLNNLGVLEKARGDYPAALECYERSLRIKRDRGDRRGAAVTLGNIASIYKRMGAYQKALAHVLPALKEFEAAKDHDRVSRYSTNVGNLYRRLGELDKALACIRRGLAIGRKIGNPVLEVEAGNALALVHYDLGRYAEALRILETNLAFAHKRGFRQLQGNILNNLGLIQQALGDEKAALKFFRQSFELKKGLNDRRGMANSLANMANAYEAFRDLDSALSHLEQARAIHEELKDAVSLAWDLGEIGGVLRRMGHPERALAEHRKALEISRKLSDRPGEICSLRHVAADLVSLEKSEEARGVLEEALTVAEDVGGGRLVAEVLRLLAEVELSMGDAEAAIAHARRAIGEISRSAGGLAEVEGAGVRERFLGVFETGLLAAARLEDPEEFSYFLESGRAGALLEFLGGRKRLQAFLVPEELRLSLQRARDAESIGAHLLSRARKEGNRKEVRERTAVLDKARAEVRSVTRRIQREAKAASDVLYPTPATLAQIRGNLKDGEVLVRFVLMTTEAMALVVTSRGARIAPMATSRKIRESVAALALTRPETDPAHSLGDLRDRVIRPLGLEKGAKRILVSPHDVLSEVPFALLTDLEVAYVPSATTHGLLLSQRGPRGDKVLALGNPSYDRVADQNFARAHHRLGRLTPLPATLDEARAVGDVLLVGKDATETGLAAAIAARDRWRAVHLACHGLIDTEHPTLSSLAITPEAKNDGFLTCLEVFRLSIPADLVVLSACETAKGRVYMAEGIVGLTRAFMMAGAPRVLCSLWKVDDEATKALMVKFYELWNPKGGKGLPAATALKRAQEFVRSHEKWKHPYYWAAWVLWGLPD